ncbi:MAG: type VI secretion system baseplate subunit TssG [Deltaproteobacteria bacterium]|jgi:type VI secretion system protein ImpH|nr:type VI secretion system baseplate subunit TssG [Deltaproteobacteria bacterium]
MASPIRHDDGLDLFIDVERRRLKEALTETPGSFTLAQAVTLSQSLINSFLGHESKNSLRFRVNPSLSFPPHDIKDLDFEPTESGLRALITINLMGLHGAASPLPSYFTQYVAQHQDEKCVLRDFLDIFNHHLVDILYHSWLKYRYHIRFKPKAADRLSNQFFSFMGLGHRTLRENDQLDPLKLMAYIGLIAFNGESTGSLESILRHYFSHREVYLVLCVRREVTIPNDQKSSLGQANSTLSDDCLLGETVSDQIGKFRIVIENLNWPTFNGFLPCGQTFPRLKSIIRFVMRSQLSFDLELSLKQEDIPALIISETAQCRLGWSTWLGNCGDGVLLLEADSTDENFRPTGFSSSSAVEGQIVIS